MHKFIIMKKETAGVEPWWMKIYHGEHYEPVYNLSRARKALLDHKDELNKSVGHKGNIFIIGQYQDTAYGYEFVVQRNESGNHRICVCINAAILA